MNLYESRVGVGARRVVVGELLPVNTWVYFSSLGDAGHVQAFNWATRQWFSVMPGCRGKGWVYFTQGPTHDSQGMAWIDAKQAWIPPFRVCQPDSTTNPLFSINGFGASVGMGDAADDLMNRFNIAIADADTSLTAGDWFGAIQGYQLGGYGAVTDLGPAIDARTNGDSKPLTGSAWDINGLLAAVNTSNPSQNDAQQAQAYAREMQTAYTSAMQGIPAGGVGDSSKVPSSTLVSAGQSVSSYFASNPCTRQPVDVVRAFQEQYNNEGQVHLKVDGKYGKATSGALARVFGVAQTGDTAPPSCFGSTVTPAKPKATPATPPSGGGLLASMGGSMTPWVLGAAAVVGAAVVYEATKRGKGPMKHIRRAHRGLRRVQRHARRHMRMR